jgi:LacI family transcriptional regulator
MLATIKDVSKMAGVAVGTVSRYLNGAEVKEVNKIKIDEAIKVLDFKPNQIARTLKTNKTKTIGVIIPGLSDIYSTTIVQSIEEELYSKGYNLFLCDSMGNLNLEVEKVNILVDKMVDGLIIYPCTDDISYLNAFKEKQVPIVTLDIKARGFECDQVITDNVNATYTVTEWLLSNKHKRIGIITGGPKSFTAKERLKGYERALEDYGIDIEDKFIKAQDFSEKSGFEGICQFMQLEDLPTAVIACNYYTTIGAVKATYELGIKVPEQLSLVGFDNIGISEIARPALSIIVQPVEDIGKTAAQLLIRRIQGDYSNFPTVSRLKTSFVIKESTRKL